MDEYVATPEERRQLEAFFSLMLPVGSIESRKNAEKLPPPFNRLYACTPVGLRRNLSAACFGESSVFHCYRDGNKYFFMIEAEPIDKELEGTKQC